MNSSTLSKGRRAAGALALMAAAALAPSVVEAACAAGAGWAFPAALGAIAAASVRWLWSL